MRERIARSAKVRLYGEIPFLALPISARAESSIHVARVLRGHSPSALAVFFENFSIGYPGDLGMFTRSFDRVAALGSRIGFLELYCGRD